MLELLPCLVLIRVGDGFSIDLIDIRKPIHNEGPEQHSVRNLVVFDRQRIQGLQSL